MARLKPVRYPEPYTDIWTGITLTPSPNGKYCLGNGKHKTPEGEEIEICCDNCSTYNCCYAKKSFCKKWCRDFSICYPEEKKKER